jgi:hypothetical protein
MEDRRKHMTENQDDWRETHPGEAYPTRRKVDAYADMAWRLDAMEGLLNRMAQNGENLGEVIGERIAVKMQSQFTIQGPDHYAQHKWVERAMEREEKGEEGKAALKLDLFKWAVIALLGLIFASVSFNKLFHLS